MNNICKFIKELREESGLTSSQFAKIMGVSKSSISRWENDETPGIENLYRIARYFRVSVDELLNGQRNDESNYSLFQLKYDLSSFDVPVLITDDEEEELVAYFKKCQAIKARFLKLLPRAAYHGLKDLELEEYNYIAKYIDTNTDIIHYDLDYNSRLAGKLDPNEMRAVREFYESIKYLSKAEKEWEIEKIVELRPVLYVNEIVESSMFRAFVEMYQLLPQVDKNSILNQTINNSTDPFAVIKNKYVLAMINNGGKVLKNGWWHASYWGEDVIRAFTGKLTYVDGKPNCRINETNYYSKYGDCSYSEYLEVLDEEKTAALKEACQLRKTKPIEYYRKLKNGDFDKVIDY